jgi:hypothetical protein
MAQEKDVLAVLAKTLLKHNTSIQSLATLLGDTVHAVVAGLRPCESPGCTRPATVVHRTLGTAYCDHHVATTIVSVKKIWDEMTVGLRKDILNEDLWEDVPHAESIRHVMEYVDLTKEAEARRYVPLH